MHGMDGIILHQENFVTEFNGRSRTIRVMLPEGYDERPDRRYPVLYMHDGQNLFDPSEYSGYSWDVGRTLYRMQAAGETAGLIVVGIDNGGEDRINEYTHAYDPRGLGRVRRYLGKKAPVAEGEAFVEWIAKTLKPSIDTRYRTMTDSAHNGMCGSSCGGNITLFAALAHPDVFGVFGVMSPAFWIIAEDALARIRTEDLAGVRIHVDVGGREEPGRIGSLAIAMQAHRLWRALRRRLKTDALNFVYDPIARHTELFWQDRFPGFVRWAFPDTTNREEMSNRQGDQR